jgi:hypothetical protein
MLVGITLHCVSEQPPQLVSVRWAGLRIQSSNRPSEAPDFQDQPLLSVAAGIDR